jgi:hypothetical protein
MAAVHTTMRREVPDGDDYEPLRVSSDSAAQGALVSAEAGCHDA